MKQIKLRYFIQIRILLSNLIYSKHTAMNAASITRRFWNLALYSVGTKDIVEVEKLAETPEQK